MISLCSLFHSDPPEGAVPATEEAIAHPAELALDPNEPAWDLKPEAGAVVQDTEKEEAASDLARALAHSRAEAEALPLSRDGVTLFRLTRNRRSSEVRSLLMNPQGALAHLHKRMADASCDVAPDWADGAKLFVPFTPEQLDELESMGLELENHHRCLRRGRCWRPFAQ